MAAWKVAAAVLLVVNGAFGTQLAAPAAALAASPPIDWPMYLQTPQLTGASTETILSAGGAPNLRPLWTYKTGGVIAASPTIVGGVAYVGSWDGYEYALNASTGALIWKTFIGTTSAPLCSPPALGVSSTANVSNGTVYVGGGDGNWYALSASTGQVLWSIPIGNPANGYYNWASPLIYGNSAYIGVASLGDCPLVQGQLLRVDLTTHAVIATASFVPSGQVGGGVWTTPSIDPATNIVYVTTGTINQSTQVYAEAMVALDATTLSILSSWQIPQSTMNADSDWGDSPILFTDSTGRALVAGINKNGFLYAFLRSNVAAGPVWYDQVAVSGICPTCGDGSVSSMAFAQGLLYAAGGNTAINGIGYPGAVRAVDPATGNIVWARGLASPVVPALAYDNGMVFAGAGKYLEALDAGTGNVLASYQTGGVVFSPPSVSNGTVFMGSGDGTVFAFAPATPTTPPFDASCPTGWTCQDVGSPSPSPAGSETVTSESWSISAGGAGLGLTGGTDQFRLMSQAVSGDMQITARVAAQSGSATQTGLMVRQANDPGSPFYAVTDHGGGILSVTYRTAFLGAVKSVPVTAPALPFYLEIQRVGDSLVAATSPDSSTYTLITGSTATVVMPTTAMVGLAAASGTNGTATTSTVDSVAIGPAGAPPSPPSSPCPSGWSCADIGNPGAVGTQSLNSGVWSLAGAGTGNAGYADQLHFVYQSLSGDATLIAHVTAQQSTAGGQAGLELRSDATTAGAIFYGVFATPANGIQVLYRSAAGMRVTSLVTIAGVVPQYLEITRWQTTYTAFTSPDGLSWSPIIGSSVTFGPTTGMVGGLAVSSGSTSTLATDTMDTVSTAASAAPPPSLCPTGWTCQDIGMPMPAGAQYVVGSSWTVQGGGGDIWGTSDSFRFLSQPLTGNGAISARIDAQTNTSAWAKAGVMMRATSDPGSPYFAAFMTPSNGIAVQWRTTQGGSSSQVTTTGVVPAWLEVAQSNGTFTAYTSSDGLNWTAIPNASVNLGLTGTVLEGLAVTSHNTSQLSTGTFDTVTLGPAGPPPGACPTGWTCADIGSTGVTGTQSLTSGTWTVQGGGGDIWSTADAFHFVWQTLPTDGSIVARAISQTNTSPWAKAGVMLRSSIDPGSPYYAAFVTPGNGIAIQWRTTLAGTSSQLLAAGGPPVFLGVSMSGGTATAYTSPDGISWIAVPGSAVSVGLSGPVLAGLAVTSHAWGTLGSATFDTVRISPDPWPWTDADIGSPALAGSATYSAGVFTVNGAGADIYGTSDQFHFVSQGLTGNGTLTARIASQTNTSSWAKAGLMLRATSDPGAMNYAVLATPANGVVVQWRTAQAGTTGQVKVAGTVPLYLRIVRSTNTFSAYTSPDGVTWTLIPGSSLSISMPSSILAGMAVTSHNTAALGSATFDNAALSHGHVQRLLDQRQPGQPLGRPGRRGQQQHRHRGHLGQRRDGRPRGQRPAQRRDRRLQPDLGHRRQQLHPRPGRRLERRDRHLQPDHHRHGALGDPLDHAQPDGRGAAAAAAHALDRRRHRLTGARRLRHVQRRRVHRQRGRGRHLRHLRSVPLRLPGPHRQRDPDRPDRVADEHEQLGQGRAHAARHERSRGDELRGPGHPRQRRRRPVAHGPGRHHRPGQGRGHGPALPAHRPLDQHLQRLHQPRRGDLDAHPGLEPEHQHAELDPGRDGRDQPQHRRPRQRDLRQRRAQHGHVQRLLDQRQPGQPLGRPGSRGQQQHRHRGHLGQRREGRPRGQRPAQRRDRQLNPTSVTAGSSSTLGLAVASSVATGTYSLTITGTAPSATHSTTLSLTVVAPPPPLPTPWTDADIGSPALAGSATYSAGVFTVNGAGADIYGTSDQFHFVSQGLTGNGTLTARIASQTNTSSWAKAGLMLRATSDPGAMNYAVLATPANGVVVQWRTAQAGTTGQVKVAGTVPLYLRIVRSTNTFSAYTSPDGVTWTLIPGSSLSISMPSSILAGMAVTSHNTAALGSATFDNAALSTATSNDFSISASPASLSVAQGAAGSSSIGTAVISGSAETVALAVSGLPSGVTATLTPTSVTAGSSSTLGLAVASSVATGTYSLTITGTAPSATHSTTLSLTVVAPPPPLPTPWTDADIGSPALAGSATYSAGVVHRQRGRGRHLRHLRSVPLRLPGPHRQRDPDRPDRVADEHEQLGQGRAHAARHERSRGDELRGPGHPRQRRRRPVAHGPGRHHRPGQGRGHGPALPAHRPLDQHLQRLHQPRRGDLDAHPGLEPEHQHAELDPGRDGRDQPQHRRPRQRDLRQRRAQHGHVQQLLDQRQPGQPLGRPGRRGQQQHRHRGHLGQRRDGRPRGQRPAQRRDRHA